MVISCLIAQLSVSYAAPPVCNTVRVNGTVDWHPIIVRFDNSTKVRGIAPEVAAEVFRRIAIPMNVEPLIPWKRLFRKMDKGELDVVLGVYWTAERDRKYGYSEPITKDEIAVFVRKDNQFPLKELSDLIGHHGLRPLGGSYGETFDTFVKQNNLDIKEISSSTPQGIMRMLAIGRADYVVLSRYDGVADVRAIGKIGEIVDLPWPVASNDIHFLFSRKSPCIKLLERVNTVIRSLKEEGFIKKIETKFLNP